MRDEKKKNVIIRGEKRQRRNKWSELRDASLPMISCGLAQRNRLKTVFCRRENHGVVGHWRDRVLEPDRPSREERSTLTKVVEATAEVRSTNWTPAAWQYNYGPCALRRACVRACVLELRYACNVTTERTQSRIRFDIVALADSRNSF